MANNTPPILPLVLILLLFASSALARPCKTFLVSTYTVAELRPDVFAVISEHHEFHHKPLDFHPQTLIHRPQTSSRDRSVDILSVLASLFFGAACGVLTGATMYLVWSVFNCRFVAYRRFEDDFSDDDEDDLFNPKKTHGNEIRKPAAPSSPHSVETALLEKESV